MVLKKTYDKATRTQKAWHKSTMIRYTEMAEDEFENKGNLFVTFNNGDTYVYKNVLLEDYLAFVGGSTDASQGKTLNRVIKTKYEYEKVGKADLEEIAREFEASEKPEPEKDRRNDTYFISGHGDVSEAEFLISYGKAIDAVLSANPDARFVVGDFKGVDIMAQDYLIESKLIDPENITVYHIGDSPRNANQKVTKFHGGFNSDDERDAAMTEASFSDIAFVRDNTKMSGTAKNILRRHLMFAN